MPTVYLQFWAVFAIFVTFLATAQDPRQDHTFAQWCERRRLNVNNCLPTLRAWCRMNYKRMELNRLCRRYASAESKEATPNQRSRFSNPIFEGEVRSSRTEAKRRPEKAQKADLSTIHRLQEGLNGLAQNFVRSAVRSLASPLMNSLKKAPQAEKTYSEVSLNDPKNYFQADIDLTKSQAQELINSLLTFVGGKRKKRKVGKLPNYEMWETFPIPYQFSSAMNSKSKTKIKEAIKLWEANTCVRFQENGGGTDRIEFVDGGGCSSFVGRTGGTQEITLHQPGCIYTGIIAHEIGHAMGFFHEQNRPDQKENININFDSINPARYNNFLAQKPEDVNTFGVPYDFGSVMHYDPRVQSFQLFSFLASDYVILAKDPHFQNTMGQRKSPSFADYMSINRAYCDKKCPANIGCQNGGYEDPNNCAKCKCPSGFGGITCNDVEPSSCGGKLSAASAKTSLSSPGYPSKFPTGSKCIWLITSPPGSRVFVRVEDFDFKCKDTCDENFLEVKPGSNFQRTGYRFCCKNPGQIGSDGNQMIVIFSGTATTATKGFQLEYWTDARGVGVVPTPATRPPTPAPFRPGPQTTSPIPSTFAPGETCPCGQWSEWSECDYDCGGCGYMRRQRWCQNDKPENCEVREKKHCNFKVCQGSSGPQFRKGKFFFFYEGCCLGLLNSGDECKGLERAVGDGIKNIFGGLFRNTNNNG